MNFPDEDGVDDLFNNISSFDGFGIEDHPSPLGHDHSLHLQVPMREPSPASPSRDLDDGLFGFGDPSLSIPMREVQFQQTDTSRLSPPLLTYHQSNQSYGTTSEVQMEVPYNSFEQPVAVVNGEYSLSALDSPLNLGDPQSFYQEQPSTSQQPPSLQQHQQHQQQHQHQHHQQQHQHQQQQQHQHQHQQHHQQPQHVTSQPQQQRQTQVQSRVQRVISTPGPVGVQQQRSAPNSQSTKYQTPRQRPVQAKTNGRKKVSSGSVGEVLNTAHKINAGNGGQPSAVRLSPEQMQQLAISASEVSRLEAEQNSLGIDNTERIKELKQQQAQIFLEALSAQSTSVTGEVINQLHQIKQQPTLVTRPPPRQHRQVQMQNIEQAPDSPQYEPQLYLSSQSNINQTQVYNDYNMVPSTSVQHTPQQRPVYRVTSAVQVASYQASQSQQVYVQQLQPSSYSQQSGPTVGQIIKQQQMRSTPAKPATRQVLVQNVMSQSQQIQQPQQPQIAPPQPIVVQHPPRPTPDQTARKMDDKRIMRLNRLREAFNRQQCSIATPRTEEPFKDLVDVLMRLLPYHQGYEPDMKDEELEQFDCNYLRKMINLSESKKRIERKMRTALFNEALRSSEKEDENLLLFLDMEYERRKLDEEKKQLKEDPLALESFVNSSLLIPALRDTALPSHDKKHFPPLKMHFDYHPFCDIPSVSSPVKSPIKSPSPVKSSGSSVRESSPVKSPIASTSRTIFKSCVLSTPEITPVIESPKSRIPPRQRLNSEKRVSSVHDKYSPEKIVVDPVVLKEKSSISHPTKREPPIVLKSTPAPPLIPPLRISCVPTANGIDSDGSCSPELGLEDIHSLPPVTYPKQESSRSVGELKGWKSSISVASSEKVPLPEKQCTTSTFQKRESSFTVLARVDNRQAEESKPKKELNIKIPRIKPVDPPPQPKEEETPKRIPSVPPLRIKLPRSILDAAREHAKVESPEVELVKSAKKKKKKKRKRESLEFESDEQKKPKNVAPTPEFVFVPTEGLRAKFIRGQHTRSNSESRETTPIIPPQPVLTPPSQNRITLKIRLGPKPTLPTPAPPQQVPIIKNGPVRLSSVGVPATSKLPSIDFSDESDSEAERLRSSTDEALRSCGLSGLTGLTSVPKRPLLPWSSQP